jgi:2'-hydroxyisoflavone reductase
MRVLVFGGTFFVGREIVGQLLAAGHEVTIHNRGVSQPTATELFPAAELLVGDRYGDLRELQGRTWEVAIDVNGYLPLSVRSSSEALVSSVRRLCFISTVSVLSGTGDDDTKLGESGALQPFGGDLDPWQATDRQGDAHYGPMKALCEEAAESAMPGRVLTIRPGIVIGPSCQVSPLAF